MLSPLLRAYQVYGANTNVGKTVVSTLLCNALRQLQSSRVCFLKPVSTGALSDADDQHLQRFAPGIKSLCLYQFDSPVSPHLAARNKKVFFSEIDPEYLLTVDRHPPTARSSMASQRL